MNPGDEVVALEVDGRKITNWISYAFNSNFLIPADGFSFVLGGTAITPDLITLLKPGKQVRLTINGLVQATGYIDIVDPNTSRSGGATISIQGRDKFGPVLDSQINPRQKWPDVTLDKFIEDTLEPFGFTTFFIDNEKNVNVQAGKAVKRHKAPKKLKEYKASYGKPTHNENLFSFVSRIIQRYGLWIWPTADGEGVVVGSPDFDQPARYRIVNRISGRSENNTLGGGVRRDYTGQPSFIVARGRVPSKQVERSKIQTIVTSNLAAQGQDTAALNAAHEQPYFDYLGYKIEKETVVIPSKPIEWANEFASLVARPIYLTDDYSKTIEELKRFAQREMSLRVRRAVTGHYTVPGHTQNGVPWTVDSVVDVVDEASDWERPMWVMSRTFRRDRQSGSTTELEFIPLNSLQF